MLFFSKSKVFEGIAMSYNAISNYRLKNFANYRSQTNRDRSVVIGLTVITFLEENEDKLHAIGDSGKEKRIMN